MKKLLIVLLLAVLAPANGLAHGGGWNGHYHYGGYHGAYYGGAGFFLFGAALGAALTYSYSQARANPDPYYYYSAAPPVYVQSQRSYIVTPVDQPAPSTQQQYNGVTELGPVAKAPDLNSSSSPLPADKWFVYPSKGQSQQQAANDRHECGRWATGQSGYDPDLRVHRNTQTGPADYGRALSACLEGRGYTVR
ncbi:MAG TPA: hypothetical protein VN496_15445 [Burkholderiales bacterium]|nr:hypothetical protein [Burkholderiales bacterium]